MPTSVAKGIFDVVVDGGGIWYTCYMLSVKKRFPISYDEIIMAQAGATYQKARIGH